MMKSVVTALTIAGSDSSGGAGIQADLKTFASFRVFGQSAITSITSQNTLGVQGTEDLPPKVVESQLQAVFSDRKPGAVKTGMLGNEFIVEAVARLLKRYRAINLVVDPVIRSTQGKTLLSSPGVQRLKDRLLPQAQIVTPNLREAEALSGVRIRKPADRLRAAKAILKTGTRSVLITGGHLRGRPEDFFYQGGSPVLLDAPRLTPESVHGTGCLLSAAIAAALARGENRLDAVRLAKRFIEKAIAGSVRPGQGRACGEPLAGLYQSEERWDLQARMTRAVERLKASRIGRLVPEVQSNLGMALEGARTDEEVIAFPGRIIKLGEDIVTVAPPRFGASRHVAHVILTAMRHDPSQRAVMNIQFSPTLLTACRKLKFKLGQFDRAGEPRRVKEKEGSSLEWGTDRAIRKCGFVPDVIYDRGGPGKEEMIRVLGEDVETVVDKVLRIQRQVRKKAAR